MLPLLIHIVTLSLRRAWYWYIVSTQYRDCDLASFLIIIQWCCSDPEGNKDLFFGTRSSSFCSIVVNEICTKNYVRANVWVIVYTYIVNNDSWQAAKQQLWDSSNRVRLFNHCPFKRWLWTLKTVYCASFIANDVLGWALSCDKTKRSP